MQKDGHPAKRTFQAIRIEVNKELIVFRESLKDAFDLLNVIKKAVNDFHNKEVHLDHIMKVIKTDFGWSASAKSYIKMYKKFD